MLNTQICLESPENIAGLRSEEILVLLTKVDEDQACVLLEGLEDANIALMDEIERNKDKIAMETEICQILLKKMWRHVAQGSKKEYASTFKSISDEINKDISE